MFFVFALWATGTSCTHVQAPTQTGLATRALEAQVKPEVDRLLLPLLEQKKVVGAAVGVVTLDATAIWGYGTVEQGREEVPNGRTVFEIGSVTKVFTALLLSLAVQRGAVKLDDPASVAAPELAEFLQFEGKKVSWRDLAVHASGLPRVPANLDLGGLDPYAAYVEKELLEFLATRPIKRPPGLTYEYSNAASGLLGFLLAKLAGQPWEDLVRKSILEPLGLSDTMVTLGPEQISRFAKGYFYSGEAGLEAVPPWTFGVLAGAGALRSTCQDLLHFLAASMAFQPTPMDEALAALLVDVRAAESEEMRMALGWHVVALPDHPIFWKDGGTYGAYAFLAFIPSKKIGFVILTNTFSLDTPIAEVGFRLAAFLRKRQE